MDEANGNSFVDASGKHVAVVDVVAFVVGVAFVVVAFVVADVAGVVCVAVVDEVVVVTGREVGCEVETGRNVAAVVGDVVAATASCAYCFALLLFGVDEPTVDA